MITCTTCHKFVKNAYLRVNTWSDEIVEAKGECKTHGLTDIDYDDVEEFEDFHPTQTNHNQQRV
jgi:hypothetical protein